MAAAETVSQLPQSHNSLIPRHGVLTLFGYGIHVGVDRGHLVVEDGIASDRHRARFPRVGHGLKRLVIIGSDGMVSLAALRWLADQDASFVMLERDGSVLATTGPVRSSDARLRRAQALAADNGTGLKIVRELISQKLSGQEQVARHKLSHAPVADAIARFRSRLADAETYESIRNLEAQAGAAYWSAWRDLPISYPRSDTARVPEHWQVFGSRKSVLSGSQRLATNPVNAILNYLYAVLESEARLAAAEMGLDPGLGVLHVDTPNRDSLACDLMEPIRPKIDVYVLDWFTRQPLKREWFFEQRDGTCRLMGSLAVRLSETAPTWGRAVAPVTEWMARTLWSDLRKSTCEPGPATRLTQERRSQGRGQYTKPQQAKAPPRPERLCRLCGKRVPGHRTFCPVCTLTFNRENLTVLARKGRIVAQSPEVQVRRSETQRRNAIAQNSWDSATQPAWLNEAFYSKSIQLLLQDLPCSAISKAIRVSMPYAADIRAGRRRPHARHWEALAHLVGISS
jgi:CRISPR-associated endonuclease Cas1